MGIQSNNTWSNNIYIILIIPTLEPVLFLPMSTSKFTVTSFRDKYSRVNPQLKIAIWRYKQFNKSTKCPLQSVKILRLQCSNFLLDNAVGCSSTEPAD